MNNSPSPPWYFKTSVFIVGVLIFGPLVLPLLWFNPRYTILSKVIWTVFILAASFFLMGQMMEAISNIKKYYDLAFTSMN